MTSQATEGACAFAWRNYLLLHSGIGENDSRRSALYRYVTNLGDAKTNREIPDALYCQCGRVFSAVVNRRGTEFDTFGGRGLDQAVSIRADTSGRRQHRQVETRHRSTARLLVSSACGLMPPILRRKQGCCHQYPRC